jgi:hypothetical protein
MNGVSQGTIIRVTVADIKNKIIIMKKLIFLFIAFVSFAFIKADNPLKNTKWSGHDGLVVYFTASDTVKLLVDDQLLNAAQYKVKDSVLTWRDFIVSDATCDTTIRGVYNYKIKDDVLTFSIISDRCEDRANVIQTLVLTKQ